MIDSIKLGVILTLNQMKKLESFIDQLQNYQSAKVRLLDPDKQLWDVNLSWRSHIIEADGPSFHREIHFALNKSRHELIFEFSLPKFWYGENIHLLYDYIGTLEHFRHLMMLQLRLRLPSVKDWYVYRLDLCYAWKFTSQDLASYYLQCLGSHKFPRKKCVKYQDESLFFPGETYSLKFYLKKPEFIKHDGREIEKIIRKLDIEDNNREKFLGKLKNLKNLSNGVLRFEITSRRRALRSWGIEKVEDISSDWLVLKITEVLEKLVGKTKTEMQDIQMVRVSLEAKYNKSVSFDLLAFYSIIKRLGKNEVQKMVAKSTFYYKLKQLRDAGISLVDGGEEFSKLTGAQQIELETFRLEVPSNRAVNLFDNDRNMESIFNWNREEQLKKQFEDQAE